MSVECSVQDTDFGDKQGLWDSLDQPVGFANTSSAALIELGLVHRVPVRVLAKRFEISRNSVFSHRRNHMSPQLVAAIMAAARPSGVDLEQLQRSECEELFGSLVAQRARLQVLSEMGFEPGELDAARTVEGSPARWSLPRSCSA